jgi:hypothetical protein
MTISVNLKRSISLPEKPLQMWFWIVFFAGMLITLSGYIMLFTGIVSGHGKMWTPTFFPFLVTNTNGHPGKLSIRTVIFLPVYKISSLKITPPKTPNSGQFSYPLPNIVSFLFRLEFRFRSRDTMCFLE